MDTANRKPEPTLEYLVEAGALNEEQAQSALRKVQKQGGRVEDILLDERMIEEGALLHALAQLYQTNFVSTQKLARIEIPKTVAGLVPPEMAEAMICVPLYLDAASGTLIVATADPDNPNLARDIQASAAVRDVRLCLARPSAVRAAIQRWYHGNLQAFARLDHAQVDQYQGLMEQYERHMLERTSGLPALREESIEETIELVEEEVEESQARAPAPKRKSIPAPRKASVVPAPTSDVTAILNVLVSLLESTRQELRGHSPMVGRLCRRLAERMDLPPQDTEAIVIAAYLHDLGKTAQYHLTTLNVSEYEGHRVVAQKSYLSPVRMFEGVRLPRGTLAAIEFMYERYDGKGLPGQHRGTEIPLAARILAVVDTYADLLVNPRNPFRKTLAVNETFEMMGRFRDKIFDGNTLDLFRLTVAGDDLRQRLLAERPTVLIVDPDPEQTTILELRLLENDFDVRIARSAEQAETLVGRGEVDAVVTEVALEPYDGFELAEHLHANEKSRELPLVFLTARAARQDIARGFELGAADYMVKPMAAEVLIAKLRKLLEGRERGEARGVKGSLREMALPDIVQVLYHGRKSGQLRLRSSKGAGEIHFDGGSIVNAIYGRHRGEEAFYAMLGLGDGDFVLDPNFRPGERAIEVSPEMLLLEGLRRLDESGR